MEAEAFLSADIDHLIDVGLSVIPGNSLIARLIADVRPGARNSRTGATRGRRSRITTGTTNFPATVMSYRITRLIILALIYSRGDFHRAMTIVNTSGWDTDCNSGNVGCLIGAMHGLKGLEGGPDWRGPLADRIYSASDGGYAVNDAARIAYDLANLGRELAGLAALPPPKDGRAVPFHSARAAQGFRHGRRPRRRARHL